MISSGHRLNAFKFVGLVLGRDHLLTKLSLIDTNDDDDNTVLR